MNHRQRLDRRVPDLLLIVGIGLGLAVGLALLPTPARATGLIPSRPTHSGVSGSYAIYDPHSPTTIRPSALLTYYVYLPLVTKPEACSPIPGETYGTLQVYSAPTDRPAEEHADLNLALRGYEPSPAEKGLIDYSGASDPSAPQLPGLLADHRTPTFNNVYQVYDWNWGCNCRGDLLTNWPVTLAGLAVTQTETIHVPDSGGSIGDGYEVLVLYASTERITLKYTRDDNVVHGYTIHVENVCVEPNLLALYQTWNDAGRGRLPALRPGQAFGRARGDELGVAIRDSGSFMDPRSRKDWWVGY
jgi:hypothetical protein